MNSRMDETRIPEFKGGTGTTLMAKFRKHTGAGIFTIVCEMEG